MEAIICEMQNNKVFVCPIYLETIITVGCIFSRGPEKGYKENPYILFTCYKNTFKFDLFAFFKQVSEQRMKINH